MADPHTGKLWQPLWMMMWIYTYTFLKSTLNYMYTYRNNSGKTYINNSDYFVGCGIEWLLEEIFLFIGLFFNNAHELFSLFKKSEKT